MFLNENEHRREIRLTKRLLVYFDREIERVLNDERLTGDISEIPTAGTLRTELLLFSEERRQLLYQLIGSYSLNKINKEKH